MKRFRISLFTIVITAVLSLPVGRLIVSAEQDKKAKKVQSEIAYYKQLESDYEIYRKAQSEYIANTVLENKKKMDEAKKQYESLLASQQTIINQHKTIGIKYVAQGSSSNSSSSSTQAPAKPKSSTKTKAS